MRAQLWLAGFATLASMSSAIAAQDIEVVANSILRAYSDYCDPLYFDQNRAADAPVDATLTESFARVLFTRDGGQCNQFYNTEVAPASIVPALISRIPELQRALPRSLDSQQLGLLGGILRYDDITETDCGGQPQDASDISGARSVAEPWWAAVGRDDALDLARGYIESESYARAVVGFPSGGSTMTACGAREIVGMMISMKVTGPIMPQAPGGGMSNEEFKQLMSEPSDGYGEDGPDGFDEGPAWERGDPIVSRGGDETAVGAPIALETDVTAIAKLAGRWGTTAACDQPGDQIIIDDGDAPRIRGADLGCDVGSIQSFGSMTTFAATCVGDGGDWSGQGAIQQDGQDVIDLFLFGSNQPRHLVRYGSDAEAQTPSGDTGEMSPDWDGSWLKSAAGGSEIEIPTFLERGPVRALMNAGEDYGTAYDGTDGLSLSLRQYRVDTQSSAHQWLREGAASDVIAITYEVDKADFGVISGYLDSTRSQAYYGICRPGAGELQCVDMFWNSRDQEVVEPIIGHVVRSFRK
jgi:hypothetical protein